MIGWWKRAARPAPDTGGLCRPVFTGPDPRRGAGSADGCRTSASRPAGTGRIAPFRRWV
ncbi:hypothetical protein BC793_11752 [Actinoplanes xinjiangensis]|jgi:hypothetical protein|uniref:Uncharacterized protein n=1 Tax=Actinoplanes xinjiangensis TaxID=512350 RepID=A0A316F594_9ACTN|nr:hypothetical protein BC793_11752 [Actinoplanes xinjiangensis]